MHRLRLAALTIGALLVLAVPAVGAAAHSADAPAATTTAATATTETPTTTQAATTAGPLSEGSAKKACRALGLEKGSDAFRKCVVNRTRPAKPAKGTASRAATTSDSVDGSDEDRPGMSDLALKAAMKDCVAQGLKQGSSAWKRCVTAKSGKELGNSDSETKGKSGKDAKTTKAAASLAPTTTDATTTATTTTEQQPESRSDDDSAEDDDNDSADDDSADDGDNDDDDDGSEGRGRERTKVKDRGDKG